MNCNAAFVKNLVFLGAWILSLVWVPVRATPSSLLNADHVQACVGCHGNQGRASAEGYFPRIAGKPPLYLYSQLKAFRSGQRQHSSMNALVAPLSDDHLWQMVLYFAQQNPPHAPPSPSTASAATLALGKQLVHQGDPQRKLPACTACHGNNLSGVAPTMPGLLGLPQDYLNAQLGAWLKGQRRAQQPDCMAQVVKQLQVHEISAITAYLSSQPAPHAKPTEVATASTVFPMPCGTHTQTTAPQPQPAKVLQPKASSPAQRGEYLAHLGGCKACHSATGGADWAGGRALETPFGKVYSSNLTSHHVHGLGQWRFEEFDRALRQGISRNNKLLYPVFPFDHYSHLTPQDSQDLFAFFQTLPAVDQATPSPELRFPYNQRVLMHAWRRLYFKPKPLPTPVGATPQWLRGQYLVEGIGHCGACHSPRGALGQVGTDEKLAGAVMPGAGWYAPPLNSHPTQGLGQRSANELMKVLQAGQTDLHAVTGPMGEVVAHGLRHASQADVQAMVVYLQSLPAQVAATPSAWRRDQVQTGDLGLGQQVYTQHCADCHGKQGEGKGQLAPRLATNPNVVAVVPNNVIRMVLHGGFAPSTPLNPYPYGMPPYRLTLSTAEVAAVTSYVRNSWGNKASGVGTAEVEKHRTPGH